MVGSRLNVQLRRDSPNIPWGFRLQGGRDLNQPLTVQRVFSSSPAEGELQRGDIILSFNGRDSSQLTNKEAQDIIKSGAEQIQLVVNRPPPGVHTAPLSPPSVTQKPPAHSLQNPSYSSSPSRPLTIQMAEPNFSSFNNGPYQQSYQKPPHQPLHVYASPGPQYQHGFERQRSSYSQPPSTPTPTTPVPPWAAQQFAPKRVTKLSKLGGGGFDFGTVYATLPRGTSAAQQRARIHTQSQSSYDGPEEQEPERLATGPIPKVCRLRDLGGGGYDFGSTFGAATLPRHGVGRRLSQPVKMPSSTGYAYQPSKANFNKYGGGGHDFGSAYSHKGYGQYTPERIHTNVDVTLSPRTHEGTASSQHYQPYESSYQPSQQVYTPTSLLLEQQRLQEQQEEGETIPPVWERRKQFQQGSNQARTPPSRSAPKIPKPRPGPTSYASFGTDYSRPSGQQPAANWRPANQFKPTVPVQASSVATYTPVAVQYTAKPATPATMPKPSPPQAAPPAWHRQDEEVRGTPVWRNTLKSTGVKPWEMETGYAIEQEPVRSVPFNPPGAKTPITIGPYSAQGIPIVGGSEDGPKVVHMQYNSPMHLYSKQNVTETLRGQTQSLSVGHTSKPTPATNQSGERDWSQSAVLRIISQDDTRKSKPSPPAVAPKPQYSPVQVSQQQYHSPVQASQQQYHSPQQAPQPGYQHFYDDIGASDF